MARSGRRDEDEDYDDRPSRRRPRDDDEDDDRPSRRTNRSRDDEDDDRPRTSTAKKLSILGVISLLIGIPSLFLSFIPCIGMMAFVSGGIGLLLGGIGVLIAGSGNHGKGLPIAGLLLNLLSIIIAVVWIFVLSSASNKSTQNEVENADAIKISAAKLAKEFDTNIVKAELDYKGKVLEVTGIVKLVSKERIGRITVELGSGANTIDCDFGSSSQSEMAGIEVGKTATIRGKCKGVDRKTQYVILESCKLVKDADKPLEPPQTPTVVDAAKLLKDYAGNSVKADAQYKGKYLEVQVTVQRVSSDIPGKLSVEATAGEDGFLICEFPKEAKDDLGKLEVKDQITVRGTCKNDGGLVTLTKCTLVK